MLEPLVRQGAYYIENSILVGAFMRGYSFCQKRTL